MLSCSVLLVYLLSRYIIFNPSVATFCYITFYYFMFCHVLLPFVTLHFVTYCLVPLHYVMLNYNTFCYVLLFFFSNTLLPSVVQVLLRQIMSCYVLSCQGFLNFFLPIISVLIRFYGLHCAFNFQNLC